MQHSKHVCLCHVRLGTMRYGLADMQIFLGNRHGIIEFSGKETRVRKIALSSHHCISAGLINTLGYVVQVQDVSVCNDWNVESLLDCPDLRPICHSGQLPFLITNPAMNS